MNFPSEKHKGNFLLAQWLKSRDSSFDFWHNTPVCHQHGIVQECVPLGFLGDSRTLKDLDFTSSLDSMQRIEDLMTEEEKARYSHFVSMLDPKGRSLSANPNQWMQCLLFAKADIRVQAALRALDLEQENENV